MPRQFDIVENLNDHGRVQYPLLLILQHDRVSSLQSVIVAPLVAAGHVSGLWRLHPFLDIDRRRYLVLVEEFTAVPPRILGRVVGSAEAQRYEIVAALDLLFTGI